MATQTDPTRATPARRRPRRMLVAVAALAALVLGLAACGGDDAEMDASYAIEPGFAPAPDVMVEDRAMASDGAMAGSAPMEGGASGGDVVGDVAAGRQVIRNAYLVLEVLDGAAVVDEVGTIADSVGGYVANTYLSRDDRGVVSGTVVVRVPADRLDEVIDRYDALAVAVPVRNVDEFDVTSQLTDIDARLRNLRAFETELQALLTEVREKGGDASDLVAILDQLRQVRTEIEWLEASRTQIDDQVVYSTVTVEVRPAVGASPLGPSTWRPSDTVREAAAATLRALTRIVDGVIWFAVTVVPVLAVIGLVGWLLVRLRRAWRGRGTTDAGGGADA